MESTRRFYRVGRWGDKAEGRATPFPKDEGNLPDKKGSLDECRKREG